MTQGHASSTDRGGVAGAIEHLANLWALAGGIVLFAVVLVNVASVIGGIFWKPFPGDFELTEMGVAIAAFSFLPFCQIHGTNVTADIFTTRASERWLATFGFLGSLAALLFAALLLWRMYAGMLSQKEYGYTTTILQIPVWMAYVPVLVSLLLLCMTALSTLADGGRHPTGSKAG